MSTGSAETTQQMTTAAILMRNRPNQVGLVPLAASKRDGRLAHVAGAVVLDVAHLLGTTNRRRVARIDDADGAPSIKVVGGAYLGKFKIYRIYEMEGKI